MERLTKHDLGGNPILNCDVCDEKGRGHCGLLPCRNQLIKLLAAYEDAEEQGRLLVLSGIKSHANAIRQMSDKELAAWLAFVESKILEKQPKLERAALEADWLDWLKQEAEDEN